MEKDNKASCCLEVSRDKKASLPMRWEYKVSVQKNALLSMCVIAVIMILSVNVLYSSIFSPITKYRYVDISKYGK